MKSLNLRIHLLLTMESKDFIKVYAEAVLPLLVLALYNLLGFLLDWPRVIGYPAIFISIAVVSLFFLYLKQNRINVDWVLLEAIEDDVKTEKPAQVGRVQETEEVQDVPEIEEIVIEMVEDEEDLFSFTDTLTDVYNKGVPKDLAAMTARGAGMKIENIR